MIHLVLIYLVLVAYLCVALTVIRRQFINISKQIINPVGQCRNVISCPTV
jgi:hypothetical protein